VETLLEVILQTVFDFRWLFIIALPLGLVGLPLGLALGDNLTWRQRRLRFFGIFYGLNRRETLWMASGLVRLLFVIAIVVFAQRITSLAFTAFYVALLLLCVTLFFSVKRALFDIVNSAVIYVALGVGSVLMGYYRDVNGDARMFTVYVLLGIFIVLYVAYHYVKGITELMQHKIDTVSMDDLTNLSKYDQDLTPREAGGVSND
jgi:hypothetical protein